MTEVNPNNCGTGHKLPLPEELVGRIVQIALDEYELGGPHILIPPLKVTSFYAGTYLHYRPVPVVYFLAKMISGFEIAGGGESKFSRIKTVRFHGDLSSSQPHHLLEPKCRENAHFAEVIVEGSVSKAGSGEEDDKESFFYIGSGLLQVYSPGVGYPYRWPSHFRRLSELNEMTKRLMSRKDSEVN